MNRQTRAPYFEQRWPVMLAILAVVFLLAVLPDRIRLLPVWVTYGVGFALLLPVAAVGLTAANSRWLRIERTVTVFFFVVAGIGTVANLGNLIVAMVTRSGVDGLHLLMSSIAVWVTMSLCFHCCIGRLTVEALKLG